MPWNAVSAAGVWSAAPLDDDEYAWMCQEPEVIPVSFVADADPESIQRWTDGARAACTAFRRAALEWVDANADEPGADDPVKRGRRDFAAALRSTLLAAAPASACSAPDASHRTPLPSAAHRVAAGSGPPSV